MRSLHSPVSKIQLDDSVHSKVACAGNRAYAGVTTLRGLYCLVRHTGCWLGQSVSLLICFCLVCCVARRGGTRELGLIRVRTDHPNCLRLCSGGPDSPRVLGPVLGRKLVVLPLLIMHLAYQVGRL